MAFALSPDVSAPQYVVPGTYMVTRRTTRRHFLFRPDEDGTMEQLYWYATIVYAQEHGIELNVMQMLSNHLHEILTDPEGKLRQFLEDRNRALALSCKAHRGWPGEVFDADGPSYQLLESAAAIIKEMAYVIANCVEAGLVRTPRRWPGVKVLVNEIGERVIRVERPEQWYDPNNPQWPAVVEAKIEMARTVLDALGSLTAARGAIQGLVDTLIEKAHANVEHEGKAFLGAKRVMKVPHTARASSWEQFGSRRPTFAAAGDVELAEAAVARKRAFERDYREARLRFFAGERDVIFPYGTYQMRRYYGVECRPPP